jgi:hypothetical protein
VNEPRGRALRQHKAQAWSVPRLRGRGEQSLRFGDAPRLTALLCV